MSKISIRLCVCVIFIVGITAIKSLSCDSKDENQDIVPHSDAEKLAKCFDEKFELKITHLDRTTQTLENLIFKFLHTDNISTNEVILTENIIDYIKFVRQDLDELKNGFKHFNFLNEIFQKNINQVLADNIESLYETQKSMNEIFQKNMNEALNNHSAVIAENMTNFYKTQKSELESLLNEKLSSREKNKHLSLNYDANLNCLNKCNSTDDLPKSCAEATGKNKFKEGVYALYIPNSNLKPFYAFCTHKNKLEQAWTIIQRREDGSQNFNRNWADYKKGFGDVFSEYWIGLERLHMMTKDQRHELWILMIDHEGQQRFAKYSRFSIASENEDYKLTVEGYEGTAGWALNSNNDKKFATYDRNQTSNNAEKYESGWWYHKSNQCNLNGVYRSFSFRNIDGIRWNTWQQTSLKYVHMAIRSIN